MHGSTQLWVKQATAEDPTMQTLAAVVQKGGQTHVMMCPITSELLGIQR